MFLFGSAVRGEEQPDDLDVLVVYDPQIVPPASAYEVFDPLFTELAADTGLVVDATLLTQGEADSTGFVDAEQCVEVERCVTPPP